MTIVASLALVAFQALTPASSNDDVRSLLDAADALQAIVEDFQCEYEGKVTAFHPRAKAAWKLDADGLQDNYSGIFIWRREGDHNIDSLHRIQPTGKIVRERIVIRAKEDQAEQYSRDNDAPLGYSIISKPKDVLLRYDRSYAKLLLIEELKRLAQDQYMRFEVADEVVEGRRLKAVSVFLKDVPEPSTLVSRFFIDLERSGHVVRSENYGPGKIMRARTTVNLQEFEVGGSRVWMPVSGVDEYYELGTAKDLTQTKTPAFKDEVYVNGGSMEFNLKPGPRAFRIDYKPGTKISDNLRQMQIEFGRQDTGQRKTKRQIEADLRGQVAAAEEHARELVAVPPSQEFHPSAWLPWIFGVVALVASLALWITRRGR